MVLPCSSKPPHKNILMGSQEPDSENLGKVCLRSPRNFVERVKGTERKPSTNQELLKRPKKNTRSFRNGCGKKSRVRLIANGKTPSPKSGEKQWHGTNP